MRSRLPTLCLLILCALPLLGLRPTVNAPAGLPSGAAPAGWSTELIANDLRVVDMVRGPDGLVHLLGFDNDTYYYALRDSNGSWNALETVIADTLLDPPSGRIFLTGSGSPLAVWRDLNNFTDLKNYLAAARRTGPGAWTAAETLSDSAVPAGWTFDGVTHPSGAVEVSWYGQDEGLRGAFVRRFEGSWQAIERIDPQAAIPAFVHLAVDGQGTTHAVWVDYDAALQNRGLFHQQRTAGGWSAPVRVSPLPAAAHYYLYLELVAVADALHLVYKEERLASATDIVFYSRRSGGQWSTAEPLTPDGEKWSFTTLAAGSGTVAIGLAPWGGGDRKLVWQAPDQGSWQELLRSCRSLPAVDAYLTIHDLCGTAVGTVHWTRMLTGSWTAGESLAVNWNSDYAYGLTGPHLDLAWTSGGGDAYFSTTTVSALDLGNPLNLPAIIVDR